MNPLLSPDAALDLVLAAARPLAPASVPVVAALGLVLAEGVAADRDYPPFNRAMMDGFAVRLADAGKSPVVIGELAAGAEYSGVLRDGQALAIMTGAPCPAGTEAVAEKEIVRRDGAGVWIPTEIKASQNIASRGNERRAGESALEVGAVLSPLAIAVLASIGRTQVLAIPRPRLALITTGDELSRGGDVGPAQIRDSNGPMLAAMARAAGLTEIKIDHAADNPDSLRAALERALEFKPNIVALTGGVSEGNYDIVPDALTAIGARTVFHKVNQRPGKPLLFAADDQSGRLFFGLPGNPLSCQLGFHRYIRGAIRTLSGLPPRAETFSGRLAGTYRNAGPRVAFQLARAEAASSGWTVAPLRGKGSADIFAAAAANAIVRFDPAPEATPDGAEVAFELL